MIQSPKKTTQFPQVNIDDTGRASNTYPPKVFAVGSLGHLVLSVALAQQRSEPGAPRDVVSAPNSHHLLTTKDKEICHFHVLNSSTSYTLRYYYIHGKPNVMGKGNITRSPANKPLPHCTNKNTMSAVDPLQACLWNHFGIPILIVLCLGSLCNLLSREINQMHTYY